MGLSTKLEASDYPKLHHETHLLNEGGASWHNLEEPGVSHSPPTSHVASLTFRRDTHHNHLFLLLFLLILSCMLLLLMLLLMMVFRACLFTSQGDFHWRVFDPRFSWGFCACI